MNVVAADQYEIALFNAKIPRKYKSYKVCWDFRDLLFTIWEGKIKTLALPGKRIPGYNFEEYIESLYKQKQIKFKPKIEYFEMEAN